MIDAGPSGDNADDDGHFAPSNIVTQTGPACEAGGLKGPPARPQPRNHSARESNNGPPMDAAPETKMPPGSADFFFRMTAQGLPWPSVPIQGPLGVSTRKFAPNSFLHFPWPAPPGPRFVRAGHCFFHLFHFRLWSANNCITSFRPNAELKFPRHMFHEFPLTNSRRTASSVPQQRQESHACRQTQTLPPLFGRR